MKVKSIEEKLKKTFKVLTIIVLLSFVLMLISTPSKDDFEDWIYENYGYQCDSYGVCQKDDAEVLVMAEHYRNAGIFISVERSIEITGNNNGETETIRALGIFNNIYTMEDNSFWNIVN